MDKQYKYDETQAKTNEQPDVDITASEQTQTMSAAATPLAAGDSFDARIHQDPKEYVEAPLSYLNGANEAVCYSTGALQYDKADIALPGKNGLDLVINRCYDSSCANEQELMLKDTKGTRYNDIVCQFVFEGDGARSHTELVEINKKESFYYYKSRNALDNAAKAHHFTLSSREKDWHWHAGEVGYCFYDWYYENDWLRSWIDDLDMGDEWREEARAHASYGNYFVTALQPSNHFEKLYGLGYGWKFDFPSIEDRAALQERSDRINYDRYLHIDGRSLKINESNNGFIEYNLKDISIRLVSGQYIVTTKDGREIGIASAGTVNYIKDRFGNQITFQFTGGRLSEITDTFGRVLQFTAVTENAKTYLCWKRKDTGEILHKYLVQNNRLTESIDRIGNKTGYTYTDGTPSAMLTHSNSGDSAVSYKCANLTAVTYPNGAKTEYTYTKQTMQNGCPQKGYYETFLISSRKDIPDPAKPAEFSHEKNYSFSILPDAKNDWMYEYDFDTATRVREAYEYSHKNPETGKMEHLYKCNFSEKMLLLKESTSHLVADVYKEVASKTYTYHNKLVSKLVEKTFDYQGNSTEVITNFTYSADNKGNVIKQTMQYPDDEALNTVTETEYDSNYSIVLRQTQNLTNDTVPDQLQQEFILRDEAAGNKKLVEWHKVYEIKNGQKTLKERTQTLYDENMRPIQEKKYFGEPLETSRQCMITNFTYDNSLRIDAPVKTEIIDVKDADGNLIVSPFGAGAIVTCAQYDDFFGWLLSQTDPNGNTTCFAHDALGRVTRTVNPDLTENTVFYNDLTNEIVVTNENGVSQRLVYSRLGKIQKVSIFTATDPETMLMSYEYDTLDRCIKELYYRGDGKISKENCYEYGLYDQIVSKEVFGIAVHTQEECRVEPVYNKKYSLLEKIVFGDDYAKSIKITEILDLRGRTIKVLLGDSVVQFAYDLAGNKLSQTDAEGNITRWEYDYAGRPVKETNALGNSSQTYYDVLGRTVKTVDPNGNSSTFEYDSAGRLLRQEIPFDGTIKSKQVFRYDCAGNQTQSKTLCNNSGEAESWRVTENTYDSRSRVIDSIVLLEDGTENRTRNTYDPAGNITETYYGMTGDSVAGAQRVSYQYNHFGKPTAITDALGQIETYAYDQSGMPLRKIDRNGNVIETTLDGLDRIIEQKITAPDNTVEWVRSTYTRTGQKRQDFSNAHKITYFYDEKGQLVCQKETGNVVKDYTYDARGHRASFILTVAGVTQQQLSYAYDEIGRLKQVKTGASTILSIYTYDKNGNLTKTERPESGVSTAYRYNLANVIVHLDNKKGSTTLSAFDYSYFLDGNQRTKTDLDGNVTTYTYDSMGRLTCEHEQREHGANVITYEYDRFGNRAKMVKTGAETSTTTYEYAAGNLLMCEVKTDHGDTTETRYTYDKNGSQTEKRTSENGHLPKTEKMRYNGLGQLVRFTKADGFGVEEICATYAYRPDGLRHGKTVKKGSLETTHMHIWDGANIIAEIGATGVVTARFIRGLALIAREQDGQLQYYFHNAHGDVVQRYDSLGNLLKNYRYDAFGVEEDIVESDANPFRYCGEYWDAESKTIYLRNRNYSPTSGRFTQEDPIRADENWYGYCLNNPHNSSDPLGLKSYVFYDPNIYGPDTGKQEAEQWAAHIKEVYFDDVELIAITNLSEFQTEWGKMDDSADSINLVGIIAHGSADTLRLYSPEPDSKLGGGSDKVNLGYEQISNLSDKKIKVVFLDSCNTAKNDTKKGDQYIAAAFLNIDGVESVVAADGYATGHKSIFGNRRFKVIDKENSSYSEAKGYMLLTKNETGGIEREVLFKPNKTFNIIEVFSKLRKRSEEEKKNKK